MYQIEFPNGKIKQFHNKLDFEYEYVNLVHVKKTAKGFRFSSLVFDLKKGVEQTKRQKWYSNTIRDWERPNKEFMSIILATIFYCSNIQKKIMKTVFGNSYIHIARTKKLDFVNYRIFLENFLL